MRLFFFIVFLLIIGILFSKIRINFKNLVFTNKNNKIDITIYLKLFSFLPIIVIKINNNKKSFSKIKTRFNRIIEKSNFSKLKKDISLKELKRIKIDVRKMRLNIKYSTNNVFITTYLTPIICTIISFVYNVLIDKFDSHVHYYNVEPMYLKNRFLYIEFESIIDLKMWNIISILLFRKENKKNERTSNRRVNDYSYE